MAIIDSTKRHYRRLLQQEGGDDDPVDAMVGRMPDVAKADRVVREMSAKLSSSAIAKDAGEHWTEYEDARFNQRGLREERFFDVGYEMGHLAGLTEARHAAGDRDAERLRRSIYAAVVTSRLPAGRAAMVLLDLARALIRKGGR